MCQTDCLVQVDCLIKVDKPLRVYQENEDGDGVKFLSHNKLSSKDFYIVQCTCTYVIQSFSKNNQWFLSSFSQITQANLKTLALSNLSFSVLPFNLFMARH